MEAFWKERERDRAWPTERPCLGRKLIGRHPQSLLKMGEPESVAYTPRPMQTTSANVSLGFSTTWNPFFGGTDTMRLRILSQSAETDDRTGAKSNTRYSSWRIRASKILE